MEEIYLHCNMHGCDVQISEGRRVIYDSETGDVYHSFPCADFEIDHNCRQNGKKSPTRLELGTRLLLVPQEVARNLIRIRLESRIKSVETQKP